MGKAMELAGRDDCERRPGPLDAATSMPVTARRMILRAEIEPADAEVIL
jgi:hypothetical protein